MIVSLAQLETVGVLFLGSKWTPEKQEKIRRTNEVRRVVDRYLHAVEQRRTSSKRERLTPDELSQRLERARVQADKLSGVKRLKKLQEAQDYQQRLDALEEADEVGFGVLEKEFIGIAAEYSEKNGIGPEAWREAGVSVSVLRAAGLDGSSDR
jgi:hypothetical protein